MKIVIQAKENLKNIFDEAFGENIDHPLLRRFLAFLLDYVIFNFSGALVYLMLNVINYHSEINQLVIELSILTFYLTLGNSHWFGGQTVGKKILRIKVVDSNGEFLGLVRSFL
ncbi:MAG: RDD family protein, partial [Cyclobacteriaceae bacterium]|nr:RDD family protein [Cyclobacteriaceae bacterium]